MILGIHYLDSLSPHRHATAVTGRDTAPQAGRQTMLEHFTKGRSLRGQALVAGAALASAMLGGLSSAQACPIEPYLGEVCMTAANYCPRGYTEMAGQLEVISDFSALFSLMGCKWGGDCRTTFRIPDMRGRAAVGAGQGPGLTAIALGQWRGQEEVVLSAEQLPKHTHEAKTAASADASLSAYDGNGQSPSPSTIASHLQTVAQNALIPNTQANLYGSGTGNEVALDGLEVNVGGAVSVGVTGGSLPVDVQSPVMALTYCISVDGLYPPRT
jgi:microcystin-dependent protein